MEDVSLPALVARVVVSLGVVLCVMAAAAAVLRRSGLAGGPGLGRTRRLAGRKVEVIARHSLSRNSSVQILRVGDRALVLGVTEQQVTLLGETDPADLEEPPVVPGDGMGGSGSGPGFAANPWSTLVDALRERTVRRS